MCGICGIASLKQEPVDAVRLRKMNDALVHRGPDSDGYFQRTGIGLAMRRLKVIDLSTGEQPIGNEDGSIQVVFNGEIYNFQELRTQLIVQGHKFRSQSDTECIVHLFEQYGSSFVQYLRGMFAIALWDEQQKKLWLIRDRLGKKPLYYFQDHQNLYFSSEITSLLGGLPARPSIDLSAINLYLSLQYIPEPLTAYQGLYSLPAAHFLSWQNGALHLEKYWDLEYTPKTIMNRDSQKEELRTLLEEAVKLRMISDVPLGAHLSGGIDSSIIVSLMAKHSQSPVKTFSVGFKESAFSELPFAREVVERYSTDHHEFILDWGNIPEVLNNILAHTGQPLADPSLIPLFHLSQLTRQYVTVAINGDGGDENFAGYARYWLDPLANLYRKIPGLITRNLLPSILKAFRDDEDRPSGNSPINGLKRLQGMLDINPGASMLRWGSYFSSSWLKILWQPSFLDNLNPNHAEDWLIERFAAAKADSFLDRTLYADLKTYLPGDLLVKADRMSMAHSLESRSPFLDHKLVEWAARLPEAGKVRGLHGKVLLRETFKDDLPANVNQRGKQGFGIPISAWCRGPLSGWLKEVLLSSNDLFGSWFNQKAILELMDDHQSGRMDHGKRLWALAVLSVWSAQVA
jgi:asparagine synthase (glutamine-hydrolysing)